MIATAEARRYYEGADAVHDFDHVLRVLALAERIGRAEGADLEVVRAAALLHDGGREQAEAGGLDHAAFAADRAREVLTRWLPAKVEAVDVARWLEEGDDPTEHTPVHEFVVKLSHLKERLFTPTGRAIAEQRHAYMTAFFERLAAEVQGER